FQTLKNAVAGGQLVELDRRRASDLTLMSPARGIRPAVHSSSRGISRSAVLGPLLKREAFVMKWSRYPAIMAILVLGMAAYAPGARAITPITQCTTITQPGSYIVVQNLVAAGDCL